MIVGARDDDDLGDRSGSVYIFREIAGVWMPLAKLTAGDGAALDRFGRSVGISDDTAVVGAWGNDDNGSSSGSAYILREIDGVWSEITKITDDDAAAGDRFGISVAISGDFAVIGAYFDDDHAGSASVFREIDGVWTQHAKLTAGDGVAEDRFGNSVAIGGATAIVGALLDDDSGNDSGSAYLIDLSDTDGDGVPDGCDECPGADDLGLDCNDNGFPDACEDASADGVVGAYFENINFTGTTRSRIDPTINFDWGQGSPWPDFGPNTFSVRWTGRVETTAADGIYTFYAVTDDGVRLWVNGSLIIDHWVDQGATETSGTIPLTGNRVYPIVMEYYENAGFASASLSWKPPGGVKQIIPAGQLMPTLDCNNNNVPDECEPDADGDGVPNDCDICPGGDDGVDTDGDGVPDDCDLCPGGDDGIDTDGDAVPDDCDICPGGDDGVDTDGDGIPDHCDICDKADGDCLVANGTPGCNGQCGGEPCLNGPCCDLICANDPFCCGIVWGEACATAAQALCNSLLWIEDVESYAPDSSLHGQGGWQGWEGNFTSTAFVSEDVNHTDAGSQSIKIEGASDLVREFSGHSDGVWLFTAWQYIPSTFETSFNQSYFILLKTYDDEGFHAWSVQLRFDPLDGMIHCDCGAGDSAQMPFNVDVWQKIQVVIDLDNDWAQVYYDDSLIGGYPWTKGIFGNNGPCHSAGCIGAVHLFANDSSAVYYDDLSLEVLIEPFGACCDGRSCSNTLETDCSFDFTPGVTCQTDKSNGQVCPIPDCLNADGDCLVGNGTQGCNNQCDGVPCEIENCCSRVCLFDPSCCEFFWDSQCAGFAQIVCTIPELPPFGACCFTGDCGALTESDCSAQGGVFLGDATDCGAVSYSIEACDSPFHDISKIGIEAPEACSSDDLGDVVPIGFDFRFFSDNHDMVAVTSNGYLTFGADLFDFHNHPIPEAFDPDDLIAPFWDDWNPGPFGHGCVHYLTLAGTFIAQWTDVQHFDNTGDSTFQVVLKQGTNCIEFRYGAPLNYDTPTVGVENQDGTLGFPGGFGPVVAPGDCLRLCPGPVLPANPCLCISGEDCEDGNLCILNTCDSDNPNADELGCVSEDVDCDDAVGCTIDECDPQTGCSNAPDDALCDEDDACTIDSCDPETDCVHTPNYDPAAECCDPANGDITSLDDGNPCTVGVCDSETGEVSHDENYDPATECCDPETGDITLIDDGTACTIDACDPVSGQVLHIEIFDPDAECCDPSSGAIIPLHDDDLCTEDICDSATGQVTHPPVECPEGEICELETGKCLLDCGDCPTDVNGNGQTDAFDLANLLGAWGSCDPEAPCACLDANGDGVINASDLATLLGAWGPC